MQIIVSKILTFYLIQSYLIKREIYYATATDVFLGNLWIFQKQPLEVFYIKAVLKNFAIFTEKLQSCNFIKTHSNTGVFL